MFSSRLVTCGIEDVAEGFLQSTLPPLRHQFEAGTKRHSSVCKRGILCHGRNTYKVSKENRSGTRCTRIQQTKGGQQIWKNSEPKKELPVLEAQIPLSLGIENLLRLTYQRIGSWLFILILLAKLCVLIRSWLTITFCVKSYYLCR